MSLKFYTQKNTWHPHFLPKKYKTKYLNTDLFNHTDFQTLQKYMTDLFTQKNTEGVNFQPPQNTSDLPVMYTASTPLG